MRGRGRRAPGTRARRCRAPCVARCGRRGARRAPSARPRPRSTPRGSGRVAGQGERRQEPQRVVLRPLQRRPRAALAEIPAREGVAHRHAPQAARMRPFAAVSRAFGVVAPPLIVRVARRASRGASSPAPSRPARGTPTAQSLAAASSSVWARSRSARAAAMRSAVRWSRSGGSTGGGGGAAPGAARRRPAARGHGRAPAPPRVSRRGRPPAPARRAACDCRPAAAAEQQQRHDAPGACAAALLITASSVGERVLDHLLLHLHGLLEQAHRPSPCARAASSAFPASASGPPAPPRRAPATSSRCPRKYVGPFTRCRPACTSRSAPSTSPFSRRSSARRASRVGEHLVDLHRGGGPAGPRAARATRWRRPCPPCSGARRPRGGGRAPPTGTP